MSTEKKPVEELSEYVDPILVKIGGKDYQVIELGGSQEYWQWVRKLNAIARDQDQDKALVELPVLQVDLIAMCLQQNGRPVSRDTIEKWGMKLKRRLFELCQRQNSPSDEAAETEGKGSGNAATPTGGSVLPNGSAAPSPKLKEESAPVSSSAAS